MSNRRIEAKERLLRAALTPLAADERFATFMDLVRELKDSAVEFAATHDSVKDSRATLAALGTVRAYLDILSIYENALHAIADEQTRLDELKAQERAS